MERRFTEADWHYARLRDKIVIAENYVATRNPGHTSDMRSVVAREDSEESACACADSRYRHYRGGEASRRGDRVTVINRQLSVFSEKCETLLPAGLFPPACVGILRRSEVQRVRRDNKSNSSVHQLRE